MSLPSDLVTRITDAVDAGFDDQLAFTRDLVRHPSTRGNEHEVQAFIHDAYAARGLEMDRFEMDRAALEAHEGGGRFSDEHSDAPIVVGTYHPEAEQGRSLILQAHVDVVPAGPAAMWTHGPFKPHVEGDWLYGRGAGDMKGGAASNIFALDALKRAGLAPAGRIHVESVVEEESTGNGALATHLRGYRADAVLIPEPMGEALVRATVGVLWFRIEVRGVPVHVAQMGTGANAIDATYRIANALRDLEEDWNAARADHPHFADLPHPINLNLGRIEGGDWASSVPAWCRLDCRISIYPGQKAADMAREVEARIAEFARTDPYLSEAPPTVTFNGFFAEGYALEEGSDAEATLARAHEAALGGPLEAMPSTAYLDCRVHALYDRVPALCYGALAENIHGFEERVSLASLRRTTAAMALFVAEWCGVREI
ncbi:ArgE/DapE family deacylase [Roseovarius sp. SCSIO 43702]|uniref:ArgE/DapE family deacylase n=1 Tax=Roseovarius sp. SCSIO 43702 TaxID=2823043 RepID=UPI001C7358B6|nr:ArgE/DapE family deacylase [Roseovarius sp. SCSIO 43702]QYX57855.1 ArgE/DapE family deacylase [Roseovarius sp. SCSIO 43702]